LTSSGSDYVLYIDEAGDPSIKTRSEGSGSTDWFALGGIVISKRYEAEIPTWIRKILLDTGHDPIPDELHFNRLDMERKLATATAVAELPLTAFTVLSHKENMRGYRNQRAERQRSRNWLYNFCLRILLERVTQTVARSSRKQFNEVRRLRIVIAQTGGIRYDLTMRYIEKLRAQALTGTTYLSRNVIDHEVASSWQFEAVSAKTTAGCQLADAVVSSFYNSVNEAGAFPMYQKAAHALEPIVPRFKSTRANHGLTLLPWDHNIPSRFKPIFRHYGYRI
jgi:hypothetical protein